MKNAELAWRRFTLLALLVGLLYNCSSCWAHDVQNVIEGQHCQDNSVCVKKKDCETIDPQQSTETLERCGFSNPFGEELICCPQPPAEDRTFDYLTSLQYNTPDLSSTEYRCTAIVISPNHVLSTDKCEKLKSMRVYGTQIPSISNLPDDIYAIKQHTTKYDKGLVKFELDKKISQHLNEVKWCDEAEIDGENFLAIGFAQSKITNDDSFCGLFQQKLRLVSPDNCLNARNDLNVTIDLENSHSCMEAVLENPSAAQDSNCVQCLTASASVLHVPQADGTLCVAGIATPTTNECVTNKEELVYYTMINREMLLEIL